MQCPASRCDHLAYVGLIGKGATEGMARQPENSGNIQTAMIISAALIEGAALFGLIICGFVLGA